MASTKDPITSHILNTVNGRPAPDVAATLTLLSPHKYQNASFTAKTDTDGRIARWQPSEGQTPIAEVFKEVSAGARLLWKVAYDVEAFYGEGNTLFKVVELTVYMDVATGENGPGHLHVPLLLGPYSYTTYRGS